MASMDQFADDPRRLIAMALLKQGLDSSPVQSWTQGAARMAQALVGGMYVNKDRQDRELATQQLGALLGGQSAQSTPQPTSIPQPSGNAADAIAGIESGGKYDLMGPVTKTGDRAYGKYQVMGENIPQWTQSALGQQMTPQDFLANPQAQDAVFKAKFGEYANKYGPEGAARAWFAGEGGMNDPNRKDQLGTTVAQYGQKFAQAYQPSAAQGYGQPPVPAAQPDIKAQVQQMLASPNPYVRQQAQGLASQIIQKQMLQTRPLTDPATRAQYGIPPGDTNGYQIDATGKVSPINPKPFSVNIDQKGPGAFETTYGTEQAKRANEVVSAGDKASSIYQRNQVLRALNNQIQSGKITPATSTIGAWAQSVGIDPKSLGIDPNLPTNAQTFNALSNESMMSKLGPGGFPSQNFSDTDRKFLEKTVTNLGDTPQANELKLAVSDRISQLQMAKADKWQEISTSVPPSERANAYERFERDWRKQMKSSNVFGDLIEKVGAAAQPQPAGPVQGGGIIRYDAQGNRIQ